MDERQREFLVKHYLASEWLQARSAQGTVVGISPTGSEIPGWTLVRAQRKEDRKPPFIHSMWRRDEAGEELISVRITEAADPAAAREHLLEELGDFESPVIQRRTGPGAVGDVSFGLGDTMILFALANLVVVILNAGPKVVPVTPIAKALETFIQLQIR